MLFLDHDIIFYFWTTLKKFNKKISKVLNTFENIMENGAFAPPFSILFSKTWYFKGVKLLWNKELNHIIIIRFLIDVQVQGHHSHQWAPFQVTVKLHA